jgi:hypothetical protein
MNWLELTEKKILDKLQEPSTVSKKVAGIDCTVPDKKKAALATATVERVRNLKEEFANKGIPVIAVLPKSLFFAIVKAMKFYSFKGIDEEGMVYGDIDSYLRALTLKERIPGMILGLLAVAGLITGYIQIYPFLEAIHGIFAFLITIAFFFNMIALIIYLGSSIKDHINKVVDNLSSFSFEEINAFTNVLYDIENSPLLVRVLVWWINMFFLHFSYFLVTLINHYLVPTTLFMRKKKKDYLFPDRIPTGKDKVQVQFPIAPKDVQDVLVKLDEAGLCPYPIAHEKGFKVHITEEAIAEWKEQFDPIFVTEHKLPEMGGLPEEDYVAVHTFFGNIPEEEKFIEKIKRVASQVTDEYLRSVN